MIDTWVEYVQPWAFCRRIDEQTGCEAVFDLLLGVRAISVPVSDFEPIPQEVLAS
jgi:hypothetical protein